MGRHWENKETLSTFFKRVGQERSKRIKAVAVDVSKAYIAAVKQYCPHALIVHDKFHHSQTLMKKIIAISAAINKGIIFETVLMPADETAKRLFA